MDHDLIVEQLLDRCKGCIENMLQAPDLHHVGSASLALFAQMRHLARDMLQAKITLEAQQRSKQDVPRGCLEARVPYVHTRTVSPETLCGEIRIPVRTFEHLSAWQATRETQKAQAVVDALGAGDGVSDLRVEIAMDGVMAHIDGRWQEAKVGTILGRRLETQAEEPTLGAILARRYVGVLGSAEDMAVRITQVLREAGWERIPLGEILGDGAPWI